MRNVGSRVRTHCTIAHDTESDTVNRVSLEPQEQAKLSGEKEKAASTYRKMLKFSVFPDAVMSQKD
jgi:hypothetical protein